MSKNLLGIFILLMTVGCSGSEVDKTIRSLGLARPNLATIWHGGYCDPGWSTLMEVDILKDRELLGYKALSAGFFEVEEAGEQVTLKPSEKCKALMRYYFDGDRGAAIVGFIDRDEKFKNQYGYSVLDAIYVDDVQSFSWNGKISEFQIKHANSLADKGLYMLEQKSSTFNGSPSTLLSGHRAPAGDDFHKRVFQIE